jgi:hypothetical protein
MGLRNRPERSNRAAGFVALVGAVVLGVGGFLPWIVVQGPRVSVNLYKVVDFTPNTDFTSGGTGDGGQQVLVAGVIAGLAALFLIGTHRWRGTTWRLVLGITGAGSAIFGGYLIWYAKTAMDRAVPQGGNAVTRFFSSIGRGVLHTIIDVHPGAGAYAILIGGCVILIGALIPGQRRQPQVVHVYSPPLPSQRPAPAPEPVDLTDPAPVSGAWWNR